MNRNTFNEEENGKHIKLIQVKEKSTIFKIKVETEPENIILDPNNLWVLKRTN